MRELLKNIFAFVLFIVWAVITAIVIAITHFGLQLKGVEVAAISAIVSLFAFAGVAWVYEQAVNEWLWFYEPPPPAPPPPPPLVRPVVRPAAERPARQQGLMLTDLQLVTIGRGRNPRKQITRVVQPNEVTAIRPVAVIQVNDQKFAGRPLLLEFNLVDPDFNVVYMSQIEPVLKMGKNLLTTSSEFPIDRNTEEGQWRIRIWAGDREWGEQTASITNLSIGTFREFIGNDMEVSEEANSFVSQVAETYSIEQMKELLAGRRQTEHQYVPRRR